MASRRLAAVKNAVGVDLEIAYEVGRRNVNESLHLEMPALETRRQVAVLGERR